MRPQETKRIEEEFRTSRLCNFKSVAGFSQCCVHRGTGFTRARTYRIKLHPKPLFPPASISWYKNRASLLDCCVHKGN
jgi:hypothetical protein